MKSLKTELEQTTGKKEEVESRQWISETNLDCIDEADKYEEMGTMGNESYLDKSRRSDWSRKS